MGIEQAYKWAVTICNTQNIGYSQDYRNQQTVNGITYYDCSSFIWYALLGGNFDVVKANGGNDYPFTTFTMGDVLIRLGFKKVQVTSNWMKGDILVRNNSYGEHTEMVHHDRYTMGAHSDELPLNDQVSILTAPSNPNTWDSCYRFSKNLEWIKGNRFLSLSEMEVNAEIIYNFLSLQGWTINSICGVLGNMQSESSINPWIWEGLEYGNLSRGYGLTQWTPASKYIDWAGSDWKNPDKELDRIVWEVNNGKQWFSNPSAPIVNPPLTFREFTKSNLDVVTLANYFLWYYEHPAITIQPNRGEQAKYWYKYLSGIVPPTPITKRKKMPLWMKINYRKGL